LRFGSGLNPLPFFIYPSRLAAVIKFIFFRCALFGWHCAIASTPPTHFLAPECSGESKECFAVISPLDDPMGDPLVSNSRTRSTSPRRFLGGGISAARSAPTRLMRCASSFVRNSMRSLRSITALANANENNNGAAARGNAQPHTAAPPHSAHFTGVGTTKEATPASRQPGRSSGSKCDTVAPLNETMQK
jgi:hypothetical protein